MRAAANLLSADDVADVDHEIVVGGPLLKLSMPGGHGGERNDHEEWTVQLVVVGEVVEEGDGLDGLAQTHLVRQDHRVIPLTTNTQNLVMQFLMQYT